MNIDDFRAQLHNMAGPEPSPSADAREAVHRRVRRARRRTGAISATAAVLVVAIVVAGINAAQDSPVRVRTLDASTSTTPPECVTSPPTVPPADVPSDVAQWASNAPVVGGGPLWAVRSILFGGNTHDSGVYRMKVSWLTRPFGIPTFSAQRVDGPGTFHGNGNQAIDQRGEWVASTLEFSAPGCWAVTVSYQGETISYQILIGDPPQSAMGTIAGSLRQVGGQTPPPNIAIAGTIHISGRNGSWSGPTRSDGSFSALLPAGQYIVTATSPRTANIACAANAPIVVTAGRTTSVQVVCPIL